MEINASVPYYKLPDRFLSVVMNNIYFSSKVLNVHIM